MRKWDPTGKWRFILLESFFILLYGALVVNLYSLQVKEGALYIKSVEAGTQNIELRQGAINFTDKNQDSIPVAFNKDFPIIYAAPEEIKDIEQTASLLANTLKLNQEKLIKSLSKPNDLYELILKKPGQEELEAVESLNLDGVHITSQKFRYYPFANLASQVIGFVGFNKNNPRATGLYGLERFYNQELETQDLNLTIDRNIQVYFEKVLSSLIEKFEAKGGTVICQDPSTGAILALANKPDFDPNNYFNEEIGYFINPAVSNFYEPGSVIKVFTLAAAIDAGKLKPESTFLDTGSVTLNGKTITNWNKKAYGETTMREVLEHSINTGAVYAQKVLGRDLFYNYLIKFGFSERTNIDLPEEQKGNLKNLARRGAKDIDYATASFGQGIAVTPIELINAFSSIANKGNLLRPYLNTELKSQVIRQTIKPETAEQVTKMMVSAVDEAGIAKIPNYQIAGKTGTAQIPDFQFGGYTKDVISTFVGFAPASKPKFVILIKLDKPFGAPLAGSSIVPAFKELTQFVLNYYNIPPDRTNK